MVQQDINSEEIVATPHQQQQVDNVLKDMLKGKSCKLKGSAGCLALGTKVLMFDGRFKNVEDVKVGDKLMGVDSTPRNVLSLCRGREQMYWVRQVKGLDYRVNENHILSLHKVISRKYSRKTLSTGKRIANRSSILHEKKTEVLNITVKDYLNAKAGIIKQSKGYVNGRIDFKEQELPIDPYYLGVWLGDGHTSNIRAITNDDKEIYDYLIKTFGIKRYAGVTKLTKVINDNCKMFNKFKTLFNLNNGAHLKEKYLPDCYIYNSYENRVKLLAGIIDTDGYCDQKNKVYEITQKHKRLSYQLVYLMRSLGIKVNIREKRAFIGKKDCGIYYRMTFNLPNDIKVPMLVERKKQIPISDFKDRRNTGIKIEKDIVDDYYGFTLDGDNLFMLEDFTVTHNTGKTTTSKFIIDKLIDSFNDKKNKMIPCVQICAPTHKALSVLKSKIPARDDITFSTIHSFLKLKRRINTHGKVYFSQSPYDAMKVPAGCYVILDEASMVNTELLKYLKASGNVVLYCFDSKQLNPVGENGLPIDKEDLNTYELTEIIRQKDGNDIVDLSMNLGLLNYRKDGKNYEFGLPYKKQLELLIESNGSDKTKFLSWTNKRVNECNKLVRAAIYGENCEDYEVGETLMFKEMYGGFHTNQEAKVESTLVKEVKVDGKMFKCWFLIMDRKPVYTLHKDSLPDFKKHKSNLAKLAKSKKGSWKDYYHFIEFFASLAYNHALSVHKSQGSEYTSVILDLSTIMMNRNKEERRRLAYTSITRAKNKIYII